MRLKLCSLLILSVLYFSNANAQCGTTISTFPYVEDFETGQGGWTSGGYLNDWAWGAPNKSLIRSAGSGNKCWVTGGLTGSFYNYAERSYVKSPCFDFTNLRHPFFSFLIFWESEHTYDGMVLQYSLNGGTTWTNVGSVSDSANCMTANWYNTRTVTNLDTLATVRNGWTGNSHATSGSCQGTGGSLRWVRAKHCISELAGQPSVMFRFAFGAGTTCNNFDGVAFDSVSIAEAPANTADFSYTCLASNKISFTGITTMCPDSFAWNFGDPASGASNTALTQNATHTFSAPGTYTVIFTNSGPCNAPATISKVINVLQVKDTAVNELCFAGNTASITVTATGGVTPYTYNWGAGITSQNRTGLGVGSYTVTVTDSIHCTATATAVITQPAAISVILTPTNATCAIGGTITVLATGGTGAYSYNWGAGITSQNRTGLGAGTYTVTVTDLNNCTGTASATITSTSSFAATLTPTPVSCNGGNNGAVTVSLSGGRAPYVFNWGGGIVSQNLTGLSAGTYSVTVTDSSGCIATGTVAVVQPQPLVVTDSIVNISCNGLANGAIITKVTGGNSPYNYNWGGGITTPNRSGLGAGTYGVTVTDSKSCTASTTGSISQPQAIVPDAVPTSALCNGSSNGSVTLGVQGGTSPYSFSWSNGATTQNLMGVTAGTYKVTVTDSKGCTDTTSATVSQPSAINIVAVGTTTSCSADTGSVYINVTGGAGNYSYSWSTGATSQNITSLGFGSYTVTVKDGANCTGTASATVTPPVNTPQVTLNASPVKCSGDSNGIVNLTIVAGNYTYTWSNGQTTQNLAGLGTGSYTVTVHDGINCSIIQTAFVGSPLPLVVTVYGTNITCYGKQDGSVTSTITGGTIPYSYIWSNGSTSAAIAGLGPNTYSIAVTDSNACTASAASAISQPAQLQVSVQTDSTSCGLSNGDAHITATGGTHPYTYTWAPNVSDSSAAVSLNAGNFTVTVTDSAGCTIKDTFMVGARPDTMARPYLGPDTSICPGTTTITLNAGIYPVYFWQDSSTRQTLTAADSGTFWVRVTGANGCVASDTIYIAEKCNNQIVVPNAFSPNGDGKNDYFIPKTIDNPTRFLMHIYDRWGALVYETNSFTHGWDGKFKGKDQPSGTYIYYIQYAFNDNVLHGIEGAFTLLR
jgi:gliding motility-associated-like protein